MIIAQILKHNLSYHLGTVPPLPFNITVSITLMCNSRCRTCNVWKVYLEHPELKENELTTDQWERIFSQLGQYVLFWTYSGGEPTLRNDLDQLLSFALKYGKPRYLAIPTNGLLPNKLNDILPDFIKEARHISPETKIHVNVSVDAVGEENDRIRGVKGAFEKTLQTLSVLDEIRAGYSNLKIGVHTVLSRHNISNGGVNPVYDYFKKSKYHVDNYICEIAERRYELGTMKSDVTPDVSQYETCINQFKERMNNDYVDADKILRAFRLRYYDHVLTFLETGRQPVPCYGGRSAVHITPYGQVVSCCTRWIEQGLMGDLTRQTFQEVWCSNQSRQIRQSIANRKCACPLANYMYSNMICNFDLSRDLVIFKNVLFG